MIDMIYITCHMTNLEYSSAFRSIQRVFEGTRHKLRKDSHDIHAYVTNGFAKFGFQEIRLRHGLYGYRALEIRLRPMLCLQQDGYYQLTPISRFLDVAAYVDYFLQCHLGLYVPNFFDWNADRIEYAVDVPVQEELIPKYLFLFRRGNIPNYFLSNGTTKKYWLSDTNVYLMAQHITVNWYDRYRTLLTKDNMLYERSHKKKRLSDFSETRGILRFEIQKRNCTEKLVEYLDCGRAKREILKFYKLIVGEGKYYTLDGAVQLIRDRVNNMQKQIALERLVRSIDRSSGIWDSKQIPVHGEDAKRAANRFSKRLRQLRDLDINPVTLPSDWNISSMENLLFLIQNNLPM